MTDPGINPFTGTQVYSAFAPMLPTEPVIPSGEDIFNELMSKIEPELTTAMMPTLDAKYAGETEEQHNARQERYQKALDEYETQLNAYLDDLQGKVSQFERENREMLELAEQHAETNAIDSLSSAISNS